MLWQECYPVISFWRREKTWDLKINVLAPSKKNTSFLYLKFTCSSLTDHGGRKGDTLVEGSVNSWTLPAVSLPLFFFKSERMFWQKWRIVPMVAGSTRSWIFQHSSVWEMHSQLHGECQREEKKCCCKKAIVFEWE